MPFKGYKQSVEHKRKISEANRSRHYNPSTEFKKGISGNPLTRFKKGHINDNQNRRN